MPYPKNPILAKMFKEIGWADELGSGVRNMKKYSKIYSGALPVLQDGDVFKTTIPLSEIADITDKITDKNDDITDKVTDKSHKDKILEYLSIRETLKNDSELQNTLNLTSSRIRQILREMAKDGLIIAEGGNRNRIYKLK